MFNKNLKTILAVIIFTFPILVKAQSHCQKNETVLLNGAVGKYDSKNNLQMNGKFISLCVDKSKEPFTQLYYRYGVLQNVEMEEIFNAKRPIKLEIEEDGYGNDRYSHNFTFSFSKGNIKYQVSKGAGYMQINEGKLTVYKSEKPIAKFGFEVNDGDLYMISSDGPKSKIFN